MFVTKKTKIYKLTVYANYLINEYKNKLRFRVGESRDSSIVGEHVPLFWLAHDS